MSSTTSATQIAEYFQTNPRAMTMVAARELGISEAQVMRNLPSDRVTELAAAQFQEMMDRLAGYEKVHVIVSNGATTIEAFGKFGNFSTHGPFFNVQGETLDMHIRQDEIDSVFTVEKRQPRHRDREVPVGEKCRPGRAHGRHPGVRRLPFSVEQIRT